MKIFRISNILLLLVAVSCGVLLFWTSQAVQQKESELAAIRKNLNQENGTLRVLSVEWDYLNRPQRLEKLAGELLGMKAASVTEMVKNIGEIPEPVIAATESEMFEGGIMQPASLSTAPAPEAKKIVQSATKDVVVMPSAAERQSFDRLIESLDTDGAQ
ncbi:MAG: hypothetical protein DI626_04770 [Micavibrio aeruginosavorus]|uniref:Cell division protein FtsL n=1 Tax=Micavibrio aeruginosavorus TaxID=349221 RepID=A0A2W5A0H8_9BACT|nr:MAG: hypothetical protein DI626_04770 [Micavibrio aeruginosavorus]